MAISTLEFEIAMQKLGVNKRITQTNTLPTYQIGATSLHCSDMEIVKIENCDEKLQEQVRKSIVLETRPKVISDMKLFLQTSNVKTLMGLTIIVLILQKRFSQELLEIKVNEIYQEILSVPWIKQKVSDMFEYQQPYFGNEELMKQIQKLNRMINPFADDRLTLKKPIQYLELVEIDLCSFENSPYCKIAIETQTGCVKIFLSDYTIKWILQYTKEAEGEEVEQIKMVHQVVFPMKTEAQTKTMTDGFYYGKTVEEELRILIKRGKEAQREAVEQNGLYVSNSLGFWREEKSKQMIGYLAEALVYFKNSVIKPLVE